MIIQSGEPKMKKQNNNLKRKRRPDPIDYADF